MGRKALKRRLLSDNLTADGCNNKLEVKGVTRAVSEHPHRRGRPSQKTISVSVTQRPEGPFSLIVARLLEDQKYLDFCCHFFYGTETKKKTTQSPCMTRKHQLKTILCITYYFMLGWNLGACVNSLYKLRLVGSRRPLCWGSVW